MESDLERYAWLVTYELREARSAATPEERRQHEGLATAYTLKMHALENEQPAFILSDYRAEEDARLAPVPDRSTENQEPTIRLFSDTKGPA